MARVFAMRAALEALRLEMQQNQQAQTQAIQGLAAVVSALESHLSVTDQSVARVGAIESLQTGLTNLTTRVTVTETVNTSQTATLTTLSDRLALLGIRRIDVADVTMNASGDGTLVFPAGRYVKTPTIVPHLIGEAKLLPSELNVTAASLTGASVSLLKARGTLLLSAGPYEALPSKTVRVLLIEPL
jgi:hypothetical protein